MVQMAFCDLSHTYHKQVTNVSSACFCHPTVRNFDVSSNLRLNIHIKTVLLVDANILSLYIDIYICIYIYIYI